MARQYKREPLSSDEVNCLIQACETLREKQEILTLLDTGLRVSELARLIPEFIEPTDLILQFISWGTIKIWGLRAACLSSAKR